ncbi:hypothetical protein MKP05_16740 [Halomonas sp. EGI 63088]|uniref:Toxin CptA n=1 Tax=Halomonas flagellata TaxID=2920385 RepID=A0ABS9RY05_9GAMM|nr:protein YgfX [Halomonas flagellata]MCH4564747.1 hypothetical protein [Halomonas flagellata]
MPNTPIALRIVPSRLLLLVHLLLALAVIGLALWVSPPRVALLAIVSLAGVLVWVARRRARGELRGSPRVSGGTSWWWRERAGAPWQPVALRCDYLGPWLIGLRLDGRRLWLWPDSSDTASLRALRRALVALP